MTVETQRIKRLLSYYRIMILCAVMKVKWNGLHSSSCFPSNQFSVHSPVRIHYNASNAQAYPMDDEKTALFAVKVCAVYRVHGKSLDWWQRVCKQTLTVLRLFRKRALSNDFFSSFFHHQGHFSHTAKHPVYDVLLSSQRTSHIP